jgi:hypothetical protein
VADARNNNSMVVIVLVLLAFSVWRSPTPDRLPDVGPHGPVSGLGDATVRLPPEHFAMVERLLLSGLVLRDNWILDLSPVQSVTIDNGRMIFTPPANVKYDGPGRFDIGTTITEVTARPADGLIFIDIDMSPIDLLVKPSGD